MQSRQLASLFLAPFLFLLICCFAAVWSASQAMAAEQGVKELQGIFLSKSYKAKLISLLVEEKTLLVPYDDETEGLNEVDKGDNVLLRYQGEDDGGMALEVSLERVKMPAGVAEIDVDELLALVGDSSKAGKYLLVDCRGTDFYAETHLPTAVSIPWTETKEVKLAILPSDKEQLLIFYCLSATCLLGPNSAAVAVEAGYKNVRVLLVDFSEWQESGGKLYSADDYIANGNVVLVDLRSSQQAEAGHIPGAVTIPAADIPEAEYDFPAKKSAPIVVYGNSSDVKEAVATIKGWGFKQVSLVYGGYDGWSERGNPVKKGPMSSLINWQRRLGQGEISIGDFKKVAEGISHAAVIVDVRTDKETAKGSIDKAILIPLSELEARLAEIPEDKDIYLHCATGSRAKMAWSFLKQHRRKVRFLHAKVISRKGKVKIRP